MLALHMHFPLGISVSCQHQPFIAPFDANANPNFFFPNSNIFLVHGNFSFLHNTTFSSISKDMFYHIRVFRLNNLLFSSILNNLADELMHN